MDLSEYIKCLIPILVSFIYYTGCTYAQEVPESCSTNVQDCLTGYRTSMFSHSSENPDLMCSDLDHYGQCLIRTGCPMTPGAIDTMILRAKNQLSSRGVVDCIGSSVKQLPPGPVNPCVRGMENCMETYFEKSDNLEFVSDMCKATSDFLACTFNIGGCNMTESIRETALRVAEVHLKNIDVRCGQAGLMVSVALLAFAAFLATRLPNWM